MASAYKIPQHEMDELNAIVGNQGGVIPSKVSDALAATQVAIAEGDDAKANRELNKAIEANKLNGAAWGNVQQWHDDMINEYPVDDGGNGGGGEVPPTGEVVVLGSIGDAQHPPLMGTGVNTDLMMTPGVMYSIQLGEDVDNCGFANGGRRCSAGMGATPGAFDQNFVETADQATCMVIPRGGMGMYLTFWITKGPSKGRYSANKYATTAAAYEAGKAKKK